MHQNRRWTRPDPRRKRKLDSDSKEEEAKDLVKNLVKDVGNWQKTRKEMVNDARKPKWYCLLQTPTMLVTTENPRLIRESCPILMNLDLPMPSAPLIPREAA